MLLADLESTSRRIAATPARWEKVSLLASLLRRLEPREIDGAVAFLSGRLRQGRFGLGPAAVREASRVPPAGEPTLELTEVDAAFERVAGLSGPGTTGERARLLAELLRRTTAEEAGFLIRLVLGELRQGALAGVMAEALASAAIDSCINNRNSRGPVVCSSHETTWKPGGVGSPAAAGGAAP